MNAFEKELAKIDTTEEKINNIFFNCEPNCLIISEVGFAISLKEYLGT